MSIRLSAEDAEARLQEMVLPDQEPTLSDDQMIQLLEQAKRADRDGLAPSEDDWTPTWDLNAAAAEGWLWKAGKVSDRYNTTTDGATLGRAQLFSHCMTMSEKYGRRVAGYVRVAPHDPESTDVIVN